MDMCILSILVSNHFGVLTRVTNLFSRRSYNIKELTVGETEDPRYSRITIVTEGDEQLLVQIKNQLSKLHDVKAALVLPFKKSVNRELLLLKVGDKNAAKEIDGENCRVIDKSGGCLILEVTGETHEINCCIEKMKKYDILEICRTGVTALQKGRDNILKDSGGIY